MTRRLRWTVTWVAAVSVGGAGFAAVPNALQQRVPLVGTAPVSVRTGDGVEPLRSTDSAWLAAPFRASRQAPEERYNEFVSEADSISASRPEWTLTAILGGPARLAVFEETPGQAHATHVLGIGEEMSDYRVEAIDGDSVSVSFGDSIWTFKLAAPWR